MRTFEDFAVGTEFPLAPYPVTREEIVEFASEFDPQPFHLDDAAAKDTMLGGLSASGWHTSSMMMRMMCDAYLLDSTAQGSPGVDFVKWRRPVRPGDVLQGRSIVLSSSLWQKRPTLGKARMRTEITDSQGRMVVECEYILLIRTAEGAPL